MSLDLPTQARAAASIQHDPEFWYADGNIIIMADNTAFRIHARRIKYQPSCLVDELKTQEREVGGVENMETIDGCPLYKISECRLEDFRALLRALHDGFGSDDPNHPLPFSFVAACLRASCRFQYIEIVEECLRRLRTIFPDDYKDWIRRHQIGLVSIEEPEPRSPKKLEAVEALNLFLSLTTYESLVPGRIQKSVKEMTKAALYRCSFFSVLDLGEGVRRADGTIVRLHSMGSIDLCAGIRHRLLKCTAHMNMQMLQGGASVQCERKKRCAAAMVAERTEFFGADCWEYLRDDPFGEESQEDWRYVLSQLEEKLCACCYEMIRDRYRGYLRSAWNEIRLFAQRLPS